MKHARIVCNQREKFQCAECIRLTSNGYQLIGDDESKFVCSECYLKHRNAYPTVGESIRQLLPAEIIFSAEYNPEATVGRESETVEEHESGVYIGELVPDGNGGWRDPTPDEIRAMAEARSQPEVPRETPNTNEQPEERFSEITVKYRFTTDNKLQVILPGTCRMDDIAYELVVKTEN